MNDTYDKLQSRVIEVSDLAAFTGLGGWDMETYMPPGGAKQRGMQMGTLQQTIHAKMTDPELGAWLDELSHEADTLDADSDEAALIRQARRAYEQYTKVPVGLIVERAQLLPLATEAWRNARTEKDFSIFEPLLQKNIDLALRIAEAIAPEGTTNLYDVMLDQFDEGLTYDYISGVFAELRPPLVALVERIVANQDKVDRSILHGDFDEERQMAFSRKVSEALGFDFSRGRIDTSTHPFTVGFGMHDVRITTRFEPHDPISAIMSTIHEVGHGLYEQGFGPLYRTGLDSAAGTSAHESQSRYYENVLGRSRDFWLVWYPELQATFPEHFEPIAFEDFYKALNHVKPSLIRVEADEVTYGLHIMLRFELENDLVNGRVSVADLPHEWNERMDALLGVTPPDDALGVLQDIHWSQNLFGYFPDYLLGSILASQLWEAMQADLPDVHTNIRTGEYDAILQWMRQNVHECGAKYTFPELVPRATGKDLDWQPYMGYLVDKYSEIYEL